MHTDDGELFYLEEYLDVLNPLLVTPQRILDIGAQFGRFTFPPLKNVSSPFRRTKRR